MYATRVLRVLTRPGWLIAIPAILSAIIWAVPWPSRGWRGYEVKEHISGPDVVLLIAWYGTLAVAATVGWLAGRQLEPIGRLDRASDQKVYGALTWIGAVGVIGMYLLVEVEHPGLVWRALSAQQFNLVRESVPYMPGVATLRYATILSGAIGLHRVLIKRERARAVHYMNIVLLIANVLVASRLALIMSGLVLVGLITRDRVGMRARFRMGPVSLYVVLICGVLTAANYSRNANYYESLGIRSPLAMVSAQATSYLAAPFQVSIGTMHAAEANELFRHDGALTNAIALLQPTFASTPSQSLTDDMEWYRGRVSVQRSLTTNSAVAALYGALGLGSLPFMLTICLVAGCVMGCLSRYRSYLMVGSLVVGYCFAEIWRIYLFQAGIIWFLLLVLVASCLWASRADGRGNEVGRTHSQKGVR